MAFATIALAELVFVFSMRSSFAPAWRGPRNPALTVSVLGSALVVALLVYERPLKFYAETRGIEDLDLRVSGARCSATWGRTAPGRRPRSVSSST